jgi:hypothetical protein
MTQGKLFLAMLTLCAVSWAWADDDKPVFPKGTFVYPGSERTGLTAGSAFEQYPMTTKDGFDRVVAFYEKTAGARLKRDNPRSVELQGSDRFLFHDSKDRPVQMRVFVHTAEHYFLTLVISRAQGEELTHIILVLTDRKAR